ncbi:helix-turn-helix domain-containing protein [Paraburkholderia kururiensis]|uniref:Helix-turn-helix domain-containing protein n=1 Tax=Paraburkholderia kururiensis TaxID=984307 RepID=A0ABZ0WT50_9BURK|nr:helix-turn-helix domain-containing protein [Paraburkholderia kururiensis]WQD80579.1 helix-turn-helix domain-containing protein [Paraburkholderia kururiensis]
MCQDHNVANVAFLIADPARAAMLMFLLDGQARPAGEFARVAGITAQTASSHLSKLLKGGLLVAENDGPPSQLPARRKRSCGRARKPSGSTPGRTRVPETTEPDRAGIASRAMLFRHGRHEVVLDLLVRDIRVVAAVDAR